MLEKQAKPQAEQLQFLRFCAFLMIFLWHCNSWMPSGLRGDYFAAEAVSFFFILSGTVTGYSSYGKQVELNVQSLGSYMWKKLKKLYPLYFITMMIALLYSSIPEVMRMLDYSGMFGHAKQLVKNVFMIQPWFSGSYHTYNGPSWFVAVIMFLYLMNLPVIWALNKINERKDRTIIFSVMFVALVGATLIYCYTTRFMDMGYWQYAFPPSRMGEYLCGMILGFVMREKLTRESCAEERKGFYTALEIGTFALWLFAPFGYVPDWTYRIVYWLIPNFLLLAVFSYGKGYLSQLFRRKVLKWLGDISFECYIVHGIIIELMIALNGRDAVSVLGEIYYVAYCFILSLLVGAVIKNLNLNQKVDEIVGRLLSKKI